MQLPLARLAHTTVRALGAAAGLIVMLGIALLGASLARPAAPLPLTAAGAVQNTTSAPALRLQVASSVPTPTASTASNYPPAVAGSGPIVRPANGHRAARHTADPLPPAAQMNSAQPAPSQPSTPAYPKPCSVRPAPAEQTTCRPSCPPCQYKAGSVCPMAAGPAYACIAPCTYSTAPDARLLCE